MNLFGRKKEEEEINKEGMTNTLGIDLGTLNTVVAKPSGILIPFMVNFWYISPNDAFLPPTWGRLFISISLKNIIYFFI